MIQLKKIIPLFCTVCMSLLLPHTSAWGAKNSLELHAGTVKIMRGGQSQILRNTGEKYPLLANDRLQTGVNTDVSLYLKDGEDTVKLFSNSFFKLEDTAEEGSSVALLIGNLNFSVKPLSEPSAEEQAASENKQKETAAEKKIPGELAAKLKGKLAKLEKPKLRRKKQRFELRTVSALIGVRGTDGKCKTNPNLPEPITEIGTTEGQVDFASVEDPTVITTVSAGEYSQVKEGSYPSAVTPLGPGGSMEGVVPGPAKPIDVFAQQGDRALGDEWLDRIEETISIIENAQSAIDAMKSKTLILSMTFTNR